MLFFPIMKSQLRLWQEKLRLPMPAKFIIVRSSAQGQRINLLPLPWIYAGRLGGLFSDSAACAPARRVGIEIWETQAWNPAIRTVESNCLKTIEPNYQLNNLILFGTDGYSPRSLRPFAQRTRRHHQCHSRKFRLCPRYRFHQS